MSSNYIIELNQKDPKANVRANGDYTVNIGTKTILNDGDSVVMNKTIIDTAAKDSGKIVIPNDIDLVINYSKYLWYYESDGIDLYVDVGGTDPAKNSDNTPLGVPCCYMLSVNNVSQAPEITMTANNKGQTIGNNTTVTISYTLPNFGVQKSTIVLPTLPGTNVDPYEFKTAVIVIETGTSITILDKENVFKAANITDLVFKIVPLGSGIVNLPVTFESKLTLPAGNYDPVELGSFISEGFTKVTEGGYLSTVNDNNLLAGNNPLLSVMQDLYTGVGIIVPQKGITEYLNPSDNTKIYYGQAFGDKAVFVGSSQFALEWDPDFNKFVFNTIHTPTTDSTKTPSWIGLKSFQNNYSIMTSYSGIMFNSLEPTSFWEGQLGFDVSSLTDWRGDMYFKGQQFFMDWKWQPGKTQTTGQVLLDGIVQAGTNVYNVQTYDQIVGKQVNISNSTQIIAPNQILNGSTSPATNYFFIEINSKLNNTFLNSEENSRKIQAIISTYYSTNSATIGTSADSIVYTHRGAPIDLTGFSVRILRDDKTPASDIISDKNCVFLQIVRGTPQPQSNR